MPITLPAARAARPTVARRCATTIIVGVVAAVLLGLAGCSWFRPDIEKSAPELASDGMDAYKSKNYKEAIKAFEHLKDWYPFSKYAMLAELKIADANYKLENYEEAVYAYHNFENLHPRNEAIPYVIYQTGMCYFKQIDTVDRDQAPAHKAIKIFRRLTNRFPGNVYAIRAQPHISRCLKSIAGHEVYVGKFYYKAKHYRAALYRFKNVLTNFPDVGYHNEALRYIRLCQTILADKEG